MPRKRTKLQKDDTVLSNENQENDCGEVRTMIVMFRECENVRHHERLITQLKVEFFDKLALDDFCEDFFDCTQYIMNFNDRSRTEVSLLFVIKFVLFCVKKDPESNSDRGSCLLRRLIRFILWHSDVQLDVVRFHCVQALRILLNELSDDVVIPDGQFDKISTVLLNRFWDVKSYIRSEAALAASRLQDPQDTECAVVIALNHLCRYDSSHTVRLAALQSLAITSATLPVLVSRCRDISDVVRKKAYEILAKWKILRPLTVSKRLQMMEFGLTEKNPSVKKACIDLLKSWLVASENDPIVLLKRLDVENMEDVTGMTFTSLLKHLTDDELIKIVDYLSNIMDEKHIIKDEHLCAESAFLWMQLVQYLESKPSCLAHLERISPIVADFDVFLRRLFEKPIHQSTTGDQMSDEFVESYTTIKFLLPICKSLDIFDEHNRVKIMDLIKWSLSSPIIAHNYVDPLVKLLVHIESNCTKVCNLAVELISDLLDTDQEVQTTMSVVQSSRQSVVDNDVEMQTVSPIAQNEEQGPVVDYAELNRVPLRKIRLRVAEIDLQINVLNESINICLKKQIFDNIQEKTAQLQELSSEKNKLLEDEKRLKNPLEDQSAVVAELAADPDIVVESEHPEEVTEKPRDVSKEVAWMKEGMESRIIKANTITVCMIQQCTLLWNMPDSLRSLFENVILVSVQHKNHQVRQKAMLATGLCCLLDKNVSLQYYRLFFHSLNIDIDPIKDVAVRSLIDIFIRFGIEMFLTPVVHQNERDSDEDTEITDKNADEMKQDNVPQSPEISEDEYNRCTVDLLTPIIHLLGSENTELMTSAAIGLAKLIYYQKLMSLKLLSRLLLLWFNPINEENTRLREALSSFISNFSFMSPENQASVGNCFVLTMRTLFKAPATSPLSEIDINNVIEFFIKVTDSQNLIENRRKKESVDTPVNTVTEDNPCHDDLALVIGQQILNAPLSSEVKYYVTMLSRLRLSLNNADVIRSLCKMVQQMLSKFKDRKCSQMLVKLYNDLQKKVAALSEQETISENSNDDGDNDNTVNGSDIDMSVVASVPSMQLPENGETPMMLEVQETDNGSRLNTTYLGGRRGRKNAHYSLLDLNDTTSTLNDNLDSTLIEETQSLNVIDTNDDSSINTANTNTTAQIGSNVDDSVFKKPQSTNIRITRSATRMSTSNGSSLSSSHTAGSKVRVTTPSSKKSTKK